MGDRITFKVWSEESGGAYALLEHQTLPGMGAPPHTHLACDEGYYILEGEYEFVALPEAPRRVRAGEVVTIPRGVPHAYRNVGDKPGRFLLYISPGGFEAFFEEVGHPGEVPPSADAPPDFEKLLAAAKRYQIVMDMT
jgi:mannose-6-phosphate isomerase-like protein (cupin superfamily)